MYDAAKESCEGRKKISGGCSRFASVLWTLTWAQEYLRGSCVYGESVSGLLPNVSVGFDFDELVGIEEARDANNRRSRRDISKELTMSAPNLLPVRDMNHETASAHDVFHARSSLFQGGLDVF